MTTSTALLVIDIQNDYFEKGAFPLWAPNAALSNTLLAIEEAKQAAMPVILIQHICDPSSPAPFFNAGTEGVAIHPAILASVPDAPIVIKQHADSFIETTLQATLVNLGINKLILTGMMTHNCIAFTALSNMASDYSIEVLGDCCASVSEMVHLIALNALKDRVTVRKLPLLTK